MSDFEGRLRSLELSHGELGGEFKLLRQELQHVGTSVEKLNSTFARVGWIIGGGFIASIVAWIIGGGLVR